MPLSKRRITIIIGGIIGIRIGTVAIIGIVGIIGAGLTTGITTITRTGVTTGTLTATIGEQPAQFVALRQYHKKNGLAGIVDPWSRDAVKPAPPIALKPGTRLVREWGGMTHAALIQADGIEWRGERYRSLSVVAQKITGARWSGRRFFGLRQRQLDSTSSARKGHGQG